MIPLGWIMAAGNSRSTDEGTGRAHPDDCEPDPRQTSAGSAEELARVLHRDRSRGGSDQSGD